MKLNETNSDLEKRMREKEHLLERSRELESMGWTAEGLEKVGRLTREAGSPEEVLSRLELLRPSMEAKADLERHRGTVTELEAQKLKLEGQVNALVEALVTRLEQRITTLDRAREEKARELLVLKQAVQLATMFDAFTQEKADKHFSVGLVYVVVTIFKAWSRANPSALTYPFLVESYLSELLAKLEPDLKDVGAGSS